MSSKDEVARFADIGGTSETETRDHRRSRPLETPRRAGGARLSACARRRQGRERGRRRRHHATGSRRRPLPLAASRRRLLQARSPRQPPSAGSRPLPGLAQPRPLLTPLTPLLAVYRERENVEAGNPVADGLPQRRHRPARGGQAELRSRLQG
ncbi:MAG: hypothetical protein BJ554DRAFT_5187 [Olpidium bornovanus]|uniref:Uncharacterized protein n=1 Tax=Olpidium bornovanus TaxID=278681 RepID=A0A8H8DEL2_9FUNG|nr:MAG: hypothetical protein BJ554DRAFT_5187 [Olpidium bornovanus]